MYEIKWLKRALHDMDHIAEHIALDNRERAISFVHEIFHQVERLKLFPYLGRASEKSDIRELVVHQHYLVSYRIRYDTVQVLQVWHTAKEHP